ncbi:hypothetical protein A2U01_0110350, partial [Trifolium medium]|nr:hypothetical protein [Trifolium medium]
VVSEIRVVEERGGPLEFVHFIKEEDQFGWSAAASSCASGDRRPAEAMVEGVEFEESDSDRSEQLQEFDQI